MKSHITPKKKSRNIGDNSLASYTEDPASGFGPEIENLAGLSFLYCHITGCQNSCSKGRVCFLPYRFPYIIHRRT
jgi:hypothetical protein